MMRKRARLPLATRHNLKGYIFVAPLIVGLALFFIGPMVQSFTYVFSKIAIGEGGAVVTWVGFENLRDIYIRSNQTLDFLLKALGSTLTQLPMILIFSSFAAILLNRNFKGRAFARAVFFLPVIVSSGVLLGYEGSALALINKGMSREVSQSAQMASNFIRGLLANMNLDASLIKYITDIIDSIYTVVNLSGMQILIYLAALHQVSPELTEAAHIDGATGWEIYWKVTLPITSPYLLVNAIYTVIDSFVHTTANQGLGSSVDIHGYIDTLMFYRFNIGNASAVAWSYFLVVLVLMAIVVGIMSRVIFYDN